jgi:hypothetical protein
MLWKVGSSYRGHVVTSPPFLTKHNWVHIMKIRVDAMSVLVGLLGDVHWRASEEELSQLHSILDTITGRRDAIVHGLGGICKTQFDHYAWGSLPMLRLPPSQSITPHVIRHTRKPNLRAARRLSKSLCASFRTGSWSSLSRSTAKACAALRRNAGGGGIDPMRLKEPPFAFHGHTEPSQNVFPSVCPRRHGLGG